MRKLILLRVNNLRSVHYALLTQLISIIFIATAGMCWTSSFLFYT